MRFRDLLAPTSRLRYLVWRAIPGRHSLKVKLATGEWVMLNSTAKLDLGVAYEVFVANGYRCPRDLGPVRTILDVGANVGYTVLYWAGRHPEARIEAVEPHPRHFRLLQRTVSLNRLSSRVLLHGVAAGVQGGTACITDDGVASRLVASTSRGGIEVPMVDFFSRWGRQGFDLIKLDCEGTEYDLVMDPRFEDVRASAMVIEWDETASHPHAQADIVARLRALGWSLEVGTRSRHDPPTRGWLSASGLIWAFRGEAAPRVYTEPDGWGPR